MGWPLWYFACGGQRGFFTCDSLQSAMLWPYCVDDGGEGKAYTGCGEIWEAILVDCAFD